MAGIIIYKTKKVLTMDSNRPTATHIAVMGDRILAVGGANCADQWGNVTHDDSLSDFIVTPGFVEGHAHMMAGAIWDFAYAGYHDRIDPDGKLWSGKGDLNTVIGDLSDCDSYRGDG